MLLLIQYIVVECVGTCAVYSCMDGELILIDVMKMVLGAVTVNL